MSLRDDERGQAIQVGAVLLFAVLIIAFSSYQAVIIPADNRRVEFNHNQEVQEQLTELRNAILSSTGADGSRSVTVALGTQYPSRTLGLNPNSPAGSLRTVGTTDPAVGLTIANATASGETGDLWDGTPLSYNTGAIRYSPIYNRYEEPPRTLYDNSVLYNRFGAGNSLVLANQTVVDGDRLSIITLNGSLDRSASTATSVDVRPVSASSETILVEAANSTAPLTLTFTSTLSAGEWERILSDEQNVVDVNGSTSPAGSDFTEIRVELATGVEYQLGMTKAAVGQGATETDSAYLTTVSGDGASIQRGASQQLTLSVRDRYNNPVAGVTVNGTVDGANSGSLDSNRKTTGTDGRVTFSYRTTSTTSSGEHAINFTIEDASRLSGTSFDAGTPENVSLQVTVSQSGGGDGGAYDVAWTDPSTESANSGDALSDCGPDSCTWDVGASDDANLELNATLSPAFEGVDLEFAVNDSAVASLTPESATTGVNGAASTTVTAQTEGTVNVLASGNDGSDTIELTIVNVVGNLAFVDAGEAFDLNNDGQNSVLGFSVVNNYDDPIELTGVRIDSTSTNADRLREGDSLSAEVLVDSDEDGIADAQADSNQYFIGNDITLDSSTPLSPNTEARWNVGEFRSTGGQNAVADLVGESATVTVYYLAPDGTQESTTSTLSDIQAG